MQECSTDTGEHHGGTYALALAAMGIVYGDIGTSPLYAIKECFHGLHAIAVTQGNVLGVLSLIFWSLIIVVSIKYVMFIMRASNKGEGGIFALLALLHAKDKDSTMGNVALTMLGVFGAALLFGDGIITPSISVLSAIEGLNVATSAAEHLILPITCAIIFGLFVVQHHGTQKIGVIFGPIMLVWFLVIALLGLDEVMKNPSVLGAINPMMAFAFFAENHFHGLIVLGSVVLCITGGEALYADMGHFGSRPIRISWNSIVLPSLVLNYFGQGALLLADPSKAANPFYGLVPTAFLYPMVVLATVATIIASQAMISGVFSLTQQAIQLGFLPRMNIVHTSGSAKGQIYLPEVNYGMMIACIILVLVFKESSRLAAAYGIAVTATMAITSVLYYFVLVRMFNWPRQKALPLLILFLIFDCTYLFSNLIKVIDGGWFTLTVAALIMLVMVTWRDGRAALRDQFSSIQLPLQVFLDDIEIQKPHRVPGTAVFMSVNAAGTPIPLLHHFKHNKVLHQRVVLMTLISADQPKVNECERLEVEELKEGFYRMVAKFGFMEKPDVQKLMELAAEKGLVMHMQSTTFYVGRETLLITGTSKMMKWRKVLFSLLSKNAWNATTFFNIPPGRVVELGSQIAL